MLSPRAVVHRLLLAFAFNSVGNGVGVSQPFVQVALVLPVRTTLLRVRWISIP